MSNLTKEQVVRRIKSFNSRAIIDGAGKYTGVRVNNITEHDGKFIVNLHAHSSENRALGLAELKESKFDDFTNHSFTATVWPDSKFLPQEGEFIDVMIGMVHSKLQNKSVLGVTSILPMPAKEARVESIELSDFDNLLDALPTDESATEESAMASARPEVG